MIEIRALRSDDYAPLAQMYGYYAKNTTYTYHASDVTSEYMISLLNGIGHDCLVADDNGHAVGYIHISPAVSIKRDKCSFAVYLMPEYTGYGIGKELVAHAEKRAVEMGYKTVQTAACTENSHSIALFDSLGYERAGIRRDQAYKFGRSLSTQYFQKSLPGRKKILFGRKAK